MSIFRLLDVDVLHCLLINLRPWCSACTHCCIFLATGVDCGKSLGRTQVEFLPTIPLHWIRLGLKGLEVPFSVTLCLKC